MSPDQQREPLRRIGSGWAPKPGSRAVMSAVVTVAGMKQRFWIFTNTKKTAADTSAPDFVLLTASDAIADDFETRERA
jgi:hypothetical protein